MANYVMLFWMDDYNETFEQQVERIYKSMLILQSTEYLNPKYVCAETLEQTTRFELSKRNVESLITENASTYKSSLGSVFGLFSSMDEERSSGIRFTTGNKERQFINTLVVNIHNEDFNDEERSKEIKDVFKELIKVNSPFYASISSNPKVDLSPKYYNRKEMKPNAIHWLNYFSKDASMKLQFERVKKDVHLIEKLHDGYYLELFDLPCVEAEVDASNLIKAKLEGKEW